MAALSLLRLRPVAVRRAASAHGKSDIDLLVEFDGPATFDRYMDLKFLLEDVFGRPIDLVTRPALRPELRVAIEREAIRVA